MRAIATQIILVLGAMILVSCQTMISPFDQKAYEQATSLKVDALALMDKATNPFPEYEANVQALKLEVDKAYEYAKGRPKNEINTEQWAIIRNPQGHSLGGFLQRWEMQTTLTAAFITEEKLDVAREFDQIIELESGKKESNAASGK